MKQRNKSKQENRNEDVESPIVKKSETFLEEQRERENEHWMTFLLEF